MAVKTESWLALHQILFEPGPVSQMTTIACQLSNRFMFNGLAINLFLQARVTADTQLSRASTQDMLKISSMGGVTV
jgi:hypothetical protein